MIILSTAAHCLNIPIRKSGSQFFGPFLGIRVLYSMYIDEANYWVWYKNLKTNCRSIFCAAKSGPRSRYIPDTTMDICFAAPVRKKSDNSIFFVFFLKKQGQAAFESLLTVVGNLKLASETWWIRKFWLFGRKKKFDFRENQISKIGNHLLFYGKIFVFWGGGREGGGTWTSPSTGPISFEP